MERNISKYEFTKLSQEATNTLNQNSKLWYSQEEVKKLISKYKDEKPERKLNWQREIVNILVTCNEYTKYFDEHGTQWLCLDNMDATEVNKAAKEYERYAEKLASVNDFDKLFFEEIKKICENYRSSADYMKRLVHRRMQKISPDLVNEGDSTRLLILKQFLKSSEFCNLVKPKKGIPSLYTEHFQKYILGIMGLDESAETGVIQNAIKNLKDSDDEKRGVFYILNNAPKKDKEAQKKFKKDFEPLIWATDLAKSNFNNQMTTRQKLYWFAIIFDMTYYSNDKDFQERDIQTNLFYDYYADNLLNAISKKDNAENEPSGHGVNFKNYAEVVYLYYLHQNNLSARNKLVKAEKMIKGLKIKDDRISNFQSQKHESKLSVFYEPLVEKVMNGTETELEQFIRENYVHASKKNAFKIAIENKSATNVYKLLLKQFDVAVYDIADKDNSLLCVETFEYLVEKEYFKTTKCKNCHLKINDKIHEECLYYESKCKGTYRPLNAEKLIRNKAIETRTQFAREKLLEVLEKTSFIYIKQIDEGESIAPQIEQILNFVKERFSFTVQGTNEKIKKLTFECGDNIGEYVTRTKMITLYYYIYILSHWNSTAETFQGIDSFKNFYEDFCNNFIIRFNLGKKTEKKYNGLNECLIDSGYQEINLKNIFDFITVTMAFKNHLKYKNFIQ